MRIGTARLKSDRRRTRKSAQQSSSLWPPIIPWLSLVGIALGALNASTEIVIRQFFTPAGAATGSGLDVVGLISMEPILRMRQLADISGVLLLLAVAAAASGGWRGRTAIILWIAGLAALIRLAVLQVLLQWPSSIGDMDLIWSIPQPLTLPAGLTTGAAILSLIIATLAFRGAKGESKR
jgi:hypothetical protein